MWWRKKKTPQQCEFWDRADRASEIVSWGDRMDAYIELMIEDPEEYVSWAKAFWEREARLVRRRR